MQKPTPWNKSKAANRDSSIPPQQPSASPNYWKSWIAIITMVIASLTGWYLLWSVLFLYWIYLSVKNKELFFVERVSQADAPITFWTIIGCWLVVSIYVVFEFLLAYGDFSSYQ